MAIGDQSDIAARLKALLPKAWFQHATPNLDAALNGIAWALSAASSLAAYARLQARISRATDGFLALISSDFLGATLPRRSGESAAAFRTRIRAELLLER